MSDETDSGDDWREEMREKSTFDERDDPDGKSPYEQMEADDEDDEEPDPVVEDLVERLAATERGDGYRSVGCRDPLFAAYFRHLDDDDERMEAVAAELADALDQAPPEDPTKTTIMQLLFRIGLQEGAPEEFETLMDSKAEQARKSL